MARELILITGVSGFIGFRVLAEALQAGYRVRAVVRKESQISKIKSARSIVPYVDKVEFVHIPDFGVDNAFDAYVNGVTYFIHVAAAQFTSLDVPISLVEFSAQTLKFTRNVLEAASRTPSIKRVVITSSISTISPGLGPNCNSDEVLTWKSPITKTLISPPPEMAVGPMAYVITKTLSAIAVEEYIEKNNPHYSVANILPGTTVGHNELSNSPGELLNGSNVIPLGLLLGISFPQIYSIFVHIDDAALSHIRALDVDIAPGTSRNILSVFNTAADPDAFWWDDALDIVKRNFPGVVESGIFRTDGALSKTKMLFDTAEDERILGLKFKSYEEAVVDVVGQYLQLTQTLINN